MSASIVQGHSWIDCTDYTEKNGNYYNAANCRARPRNWAAHNAINSAFGGDTGYNQQDLACKYALSNSNVATFYTSAFPMATYKPGQEVCLAWPAKNHVAATCTNQYIPDNGNKIYISKINPASDPSPTDWSLLVDWGTKSTPGAGGQPGFQNCPKFCENMDKALCTGCFTIPSNLAEGRYAFQWRWTFNPGTPYTSCWDASVTASSTPVTPTPPPSSSATPPPNNNNNSPLVGNSIRITAPPKSVPLKSKTITLSVDYSATAASDIVVDFMSVPEYKWFGKAIQTNVQAGSGTLSMTVQIQNNPVEGTYVIKPWIVAAGKGEAAMGWVDELDRKEYQLAFTDKIVLSGSNSMLFAIGCLSTLIAVLINLLAL